MPSHVATALVAKFPSLCKTGAWTVLALSLIQFILCSAEEEKNILMLWLHIERLGKFGSNHP